MLKSSIRTPKFIPGGLALAALLCWVPASQATVYTGSASDPGDDLEIYAGEELPDPPVNFTAVAVKYDDTAGRVDVSYSFSQAPEPDQQIHAGVGLGYIQDGQCNAAFFHSVGWHTENSSEGQAFVEGHFDGTVTGATWDSDPGGDPWDGAELFEWSGNKQTWNFATMQPELRDRPYTCVNAGMAVWDDSGGGPVGEDSLDGPAFELKPVPKPSPPSSTAPNPEVLTPSASSAPTGDKPASRLTRTKALRALRNALAERFGNRFRNRHSYAVKCEKKSASRWTCAVRWHHGQFVYKAKLKITLGPDGRVAARLRGSPSRAPSVVAGNQVPGAAQLAFELALG